MGNVQSLEVVVSDTLFLCCLRSYAKFLGVASLCI